jgi:FkbM family methyltransferase
MKWLIQSALQQFGLRLVRIREASHRDFGPSVLFKVLQEAGFAPEHVLDVGANHGNWTRVAIRAFPDADYTLLEPQNDLKTHVQDLLNSGRKIRWINGGASDKTETLPFHLSHRDDSSSFLSSDDAPHKIVPVKVWSLDDLLAEHSLPWPQMVKIDAEGFDLKVLRGASGLLGRTDVFLVEAAVLCPFENSVAATVQFMAEHGYRLIDITEINRSPKTNVLWLTELAFLREGSPLLAAANSYE